MAPRKMDPVKRLSSVKSMVPLEKFGNESKKYIIESEDMMADTKDKKP